MRRRLGAALSLLALFGACGGDDPSLVVEPPTQDPGRATECEDRTSGAEALIEMEDFRFVPACVEMTTGQGLTNTNNGSALHNFSVDGFPGIDVDTEAGQTNRYEPLGLDAGNYTFFCKYHRESGMEGELRISKA